MKSALRNFIVPNIVQSNARTFTTAYRLHAKTKIWNYSVRSTSNPIMNTKNTESVIKQQNFDSFLVLDFEATCEDGRRIMPHQEIIEFPVVLLSGKSFKEIKRFHRYVRPTERPILSSFCTDLTGIVQEALPEVLNAFDEWLIDSNLINSDHTMKSSFTFITCGDWDLGVLLPDEAKYRKLQLPEYFKKWINLKKAFHKSKGYFAKSLTVMLHDLKLSHIGRLHSGIDDVQNICQVARCLANSGYVFQNTSVYSDEKCSFENL